MKPSNSTLAGVGIGVPVAIIVAWIISLFGIVMPPEVQTALGAVLSPLIGYFFIGGKKVDTEDDPLVGNNQAGFANALLLAALAILAMIGMSACVTPPHKVIETACTAGTKYSVERCVKGIAETWEVYQIRAEMIVADPATPPEVKQAVQAAEAESRPVVRDTLLAGAIYAEIKQQVAEGETEADKLAIANAKLEEWVAKALPLVRSFGEKLGR